MLNFENDPHAFRAFITAHQGRVYNAILNRVQDVKDAEEITQDVFIDVFRHPEAFRGEAAVGTWLYRIAMNKCVDHLRKKIRRNKWSINAAAEIVGKKKVNPQQATSFIPVLPPKTARMLRYSLKPCKQLPEKTTHGLGAE